MIEFTGDEGLFNLRATFQGGVPPQDSDDTACMYATWVDVGAPIVVTPGLISSVGTRTASNHSRFKWNLSKYGNPVKWFITKPGDDKTKGFHYDRVEAGAGISLGYPSPFFLELCADGSGGILRPITSENGVADRNSYCVGVSQRGIVEIMSVAAPNRESSEPTPAWQAYSTPGRLMLPETHSKEGH
ncbi:hypothetical protein RHS04_01350 [Rhizoctonia solani]|uniref:Uncharacterized protein n=2 Tax=Rhizoctonia solani TaxID=456999 RepID=A0A8H7HE19_9AGAM